MTAAGLNIPLICWGSWSPPTPLRCTRYRAVILAVCEGAPMLLTRGVLYTAITRARELLILVGDEDVVAHMTANDRQQRRYSGLRWRLAQLANG